MYWRGVILNDLGHVVKSEIELPFWCNPVLVWILCPAMTLLIKSNPTSTGNPVSLSFPFTLVMNVLKNGPWWGHAKQRSTEGMSGCW